MKIHQFTDYWCNCLYQIILIKKLLLKKSILKKMLMGKINDDNTWKCIHACIFINLINYKISFHVDNIGSLVKRNGERTFLPCTPKGILELLNRTGKNNI